MNVEPLLSDLTVKWETALVPIRVNLTLFVDLESNLGKRPWRWTAQDLASLPVEDAAVAWAEDLLRIILPSLHSDLVVVNLTAQMSAERIVSDESSVIEVNQNSRPILVRVLKQDTLAWWNVI